MSTEELGYILKMLFHVRIVCKNDQSRAANGCKLC